MWPIQEWIAFCSSSGIHAFRIHTPIQVRIQAKINPFSKKNQETGKTFPSFFDGGRGLLFHCAKAILTIRLLSYLLCYINHC